MNKRPPLRAGQASHQDRRTPTWALPRHGRLVLALLTSGLLGACASMDPGAEFAPAEPPPQITTVSQKAPASDTAPQAQGPGNAEPAPASASTAATDAAANPSQAVTSPVRVAEGPLAPLPFDTPSKAIPAPATAAAKADEGADAAGTPSDPLEPDQPVLLGLGAAHTDLWTRVRAGFGMPLLDNDLVREHERWYANRPDYVQRMTERGARYLYHIVAEVERRKMPTELALLPFIESAYNPQAMSTARASGMWQFIPSTGRDYDLKQNLFRDDRRDVLASTRAALDYLGRLNAEFNDWQLSLAAYNWGEGNVRRAIARNQKAGLPTDYESLRMPAETRHYVPKLQAVKNIVADAGNFGLTLPAIQNHPYFLSVPIQRDIDVTLAARLAGLTPDEFRSLNPQHNKPVILAAGTPQVLLPYDNADRFVSNLKAHRGALASWTAWVAPRTLKPGEAARLTGMNEATLREVNRIPPRMLVKAGSALLVPRSDNRVEDVPEHVAENGQMALAPEPVPLRRVAIKARKGDTLASLARRHKVNVAQVAQWNKLSPTASLKTGQVVVLMRAAGKTAPRKAAAVASAVRKPATKAGAKVASGSRAAAGGSGSRARPAIKVSASRSER